jgi:hypothetical protein
LSRISKRKNLSPQIYADKRESGESKSLPLINTDDTDWESGDFDLHALFQQGRHAYGSTKLGTHWQKEVTVPKKLFRGLCWFSSIDGSLDRQENV